MTLISDGSEVREQQGKWDGGEWEDEAHTLTFRFLGRLRVGEDGFESFVYYNLLAVFLWFPEARVVVKSGETWIGHD